MKISGIRKTDGVTILDIEGKILLGDGDEEIPNRIFELIRKGEKNFLLNVGNVPYIDSAGLCGIIRSLAASSKKGGALKILAPNQRLINLLGVTRLVHVFDWYSKEDAALESFRQGIPLPHPA